MTHSDLYRELWMDQLMAIVEDENFSLEVRMSAWIEYKKLHRERSPERVREMERERGLAR